MRGPCRRPWTTVKQCVQPTARRSSTAHPGRQVSLARSHCLQLLRKSDYAAYVFQTFIPAHARDGYLAVMALNCEVSRIPDTTSTTAVGQIRMQFWRDAARRALAGSPPSEPVAILLAAAAEQLAMARISAATTASKTTPTFSLAWLNRLVSARENRLAGNRPFPDLAAMESYAEHTYSTLLYLVLSAYPIASIAMDHVASHIGKAAGIATLLRGLPATAFPAASPSSSSAFAVSGGTSRTQGSVVLPLDVMVAAGVQEEDVFRQGPNAAGLKDAVFEVATRANDHLITARTMLEQLLSTSTSDSPVDHPYEHQFDPDGRDYTATLGGKSLKDGDLARFAFGAFLPAISTRLWLERLEKADFDLFDSKLRRIEWKLPLAAYWAYSRRQI